MILALLLACAAEPAAVAPVSKPVPALSPAAASADALVPEGWTVVQQLSGDLDGDNIADEVALLSRTVGDELQATLRLRMKGVVREAPNAVCAQCGGVKGTPVPFELELDEARHVLSISYFGGSREVRMRTTKWRRQGDTLALIGLVEHFYDSFPEGVGALAGNTAEANYSTGQMDWKVETVSGPPAKADEMPPTTETVVRCAIPAGPRPDLFSYDHGSFEAPRCP